MRCIRFVQPRLNARLRWLCAISVIFSSMAQAQTGRELKGVVTDSSGIPLFGAIVEVAGSSMKTRTNERGEFLITGMTPGNATITFRRLGFAGTSRSAQLVDGQSAPALNIALAALPTMVKPVVVQAGRVEYSGRLAGYYERLHRKSNGSFINREQIDRANNKTLSQLLASSPGISALSLSSGGGGVRIRGMRCRPLVWLDGVPLPAGEVDLDAFPLNTLHGIELYLGATNSPPGYTALEGRSSCGTILLWSRGRDTENQTAAQHAPRDVEDLTATDALYTADQVDTPAHLAGSPLNVNYPPDLVASRTAGSAVAEFVVAPSGEIEGGSLEIFSASNPLFGEAVKQALWRARYIPAVKGGVAVRQLVRQPFNFSLDAEPIGNTAQLGGKTR
jgi:TonB family protein